MKSLSSTPGAATTCTLLVAALFLGCETAPEELRAAHQESLDAIARYGANAEEAVATLAAGYREASRREFRLVAERDLGRRAERVARFDATGALVEEPMLSPAQAGEALDDYREGLDRIEAEVRRFFVGWDEPALDDAGAPILGPDGLPVVIHHPGWDEVAGELAEALALQETVRDWLAREGIQPEHIDAISRAIAGEIEKRGRR